VIVQYSSLFRLLKFKITPYEFLAANALVRLLKNTIKEGRSQFRSLFTLLSDIFRLCKFAPNALCYMQDMQYFCTALANHRWLNM